jgi:hypothetical protein
VFRSRRIPRHMLLDQGGGDHHWLRRMLTIVLSLLVGFGLGVLASEGGLRSGNCQTANYSFSEREPATADRTTSGVARLDSP